MSKVKLQNLKACPIWDATHVKNIHVESYNPGFAIQIKYPSFDAAAHCRWRPIFSKKKNPRKPEAVMCLLVHLVQI